MSTQDLEIPKLELCDALDLAILIEEEAHERYEELAQQMEQHRTPAAATFFRFMAHNEAKHGAQLARRRSDLFGAAPKKVHRSMLWDVEAPDYDVARAFMSAREAMLAALRSEEKAYAFFVAALPNVTDAAVRRLFEELRDEELVHQSLIGDELARLPEGDDPGSDGFVDDPTGQ